MRLSDRRKVDLPDDARRSKEMITKKMELFMVRRLTKATKQQM